MLLASKTHSEACKKGRVSRNTLHRWLKDPDFEAELDRQRDELAAQSLNRLPQSLTKAVGTLADLLESPDGRLKRMAAKDILDQYVRFKEQEELVRRIEAVEERVEGKA